MSAKCLKISFLTIFRILGDTIENKNVKIINDKGEIVHKASSFSLDPFKLSPGRYIVTVDDISITVSEIELKENAVYVLMILEADNQHVNP